MNSYQITILTKEEEISRKLADILIHKGYVCNVISSEEELTDSRPTDLVLVDINDELLEYNIERLSRHIKQDQHSSVLLIVSNNIPQNIENDNNIDDFIVKPYDAGELLVRIKRLLVKNKTLEASDEVLKAGDIIIDLQRCEVTVSGRIVDLTFTEYELLKLLMSEKGRVLSREILLNKIWGYDYYGGDRTVDVHITRLRSKIEDPAHSFIETVRNIGYRIKADGK